MGTSWKRTTNKQFLTDLVNEADCDLMLMMVVMQALDQFGTSVSKADPAKMDTPLFSGEAWVGAGKKLKALVDSHLTPPQKVA